MGTDNHTEDPEGGQDMDNEELDLPGPVADALRHVPAATRDTKDAHIAASLSAWEAESARPMTVTHLDSRRRALFSSAAACLLVVGGAIGWTLHSPGVGQVAADTSVRAATRPSTVAPLTSTTVAKGDATTATAGTPQCASGELQPIDSTYIGEFDAADGRTYLVFTFNGMLEFVDKDTCQWVNLVPGTTTP
ncbi:MAG: hypothetical protein RJA47_1905 [Actinomycetota bacterium]|jgi:hypothetical protein